MLSIIEELGDPSRRRILISLLSGPKNVSQIVAETGFKQPNVSNHLARLRAKHVVTAVRVGRTINYALSNFAIQQAVQQSSLSLNLVRTESDWTSAIDEFSQKAINGDKQGCMDILRSVFTNEISLEKIYSDFLTPVMQKIGDWYHEGIIDVGQEHFASEIMQRVMSRAALMRPPERLLGKTVVMGCSPNNFHGIALRMMGDVLRIRGWEVLYLGTNVPIDAFVAAIQRHNPDLALVSCGGTDTGSSLAMVRALAGLKPAYPHLTIVGGGHHVASDPESYLKAGLDQWSSSLKEFVEVIAPQLESQSATATVTA